MRKSTQKVAAAAFTTLLLVAGCKTEPLATGMAKAYQTNCSYCHGDDENAAPPSALNGAHSSTDIGVGAHQKHLRSGNIFQKVECERCHIVPENVDDPKHLRESSKDSHAEVVFSELARTGDLNPTWNRSRAQCSDVYCHGASLSGGKHAQPIWTRVDGSQVECDGCHGNPPPLPHMQNGRFFDCSICHPDTVDTDGNIKVADELHINGDIEAAVECNSCHGAQSDGERPWFAVSGSDQTDDIAVGAHQTHVVSGKIAKAIECKQCHVVPVTVRAEGHWADSPDDEHAEVVFGDLAKTGGLSPAWDRDRGQCVNVFCHGTLLKGGNQIEPVWIRVDQSQIQCDSCHGNPPPLPHLQGTHIAKCATCHPDTVEENDEIKVQSGTHVNGKIEASARCYACHGTKDINTAPPVALDGSTQPTNMGVGAHQAHMQGKKFSKGIACEQCHVVPGCTDCHSGPVGTRPHYAAYGPDHTYANVVFDHLAKTGDLTPTWNRNRAQCTNTYCHGASLIGKTKVKPIWNSPDENQVQCGSCHDVPPPPPHEQKDTCENCHSLTVTGNKQLNLASGAHINGEITVPAAPR